MLSQGPGAALRRVAAAVVVAALASACENVSPYTERNYARVGLPVLMERLSTTKDRSGGPFPAASVAIGSLYEQGFNHVTAFEAEYSLYTLAPGGPLNGYGNGYYGGIRRFWNMDGRLRPNGGLGAMWQDFRVTNLTRSNDPSGPGAYADLGLDFMMTATHSIGARLRALSRYELADRHHGMRNGLEFTLQSSWRF